MYRTEQIRNVVLAGHPGAGKTMLFEALLHAGGAITTAGTIERGSTVSDFDPMEKTRGHSLNTAIASTDHSPSTGPAIHLNLIDTPGYADFRGPTLSAFSAVETVCVVVNANRGIEYGTRRMMEHAHARNLCRVLIINKIDDTDPAKLTTLIEQLREAFGPECLPINLPTNNGTAVVDCFFNPVGPSDIEDVASAHQRIIDQVVEINETVMNRYLEEGEAGLSGTELHDAFEQCLREGHLVPICFVSARTGAGIKELLDLAERLFPSPLEGNPPAFLKGSGADATPIAAMPDPNAHVIADVFKIVNDPFVGKLSIFRVFQGTVRKDTQLFIDDGKKPFRVGHLFKLKGREHVEVDLAIPGDIVGVAKIEEIHFDAVLHDSHDEDHIHLKPIEMPHPMFGLAVEAATRGQEQKLTNGLHKLVEEDPGFHVEHQPELNETVLRGLGELHLRVMVERLKERYGVDVKTRPPRIAYRETVSIPAEGHHRHKKQTGGAGQFGEVFLRIEPIERGNGFEFVDAVKGGTIPGQYLPAIEKGVRQVLSGGAVAGYPLQDVRVTVYDGKFHAVDSKEIAFVVAGKKAFLDAIGKARPQVLEPIVHLTVTAPESHMGGITGALSAKRSRINGTDAAGDGDIQIKASVPLSELADYAAELKGSTAGSGRYELEFSHYEPVPGAMQKQLIDAYKPRPDED